MTQIFKLRPETSRDVADQLKDFAIKKLQGKMGADVVTIYTQQERTRIYGIEMVYSNIISPEFIDQSTQILMHISAAIREQEIILNLNS